MAVKSGCAAILCVLVLQGFHHQAAANPLAKAKQYYGGDGGSHLANGGNVVGSAEEMVLDRGKTICWNAAYGDSAGSLEFDYPICSRDGSAFWVHQTNGNGDHFCVDKKGNIVKRLTWQYIEDHPQLKEDDSYFFNGDKYCAALLGIPYTYDWYMNF